MTEIVALLQNPSPESFGVVPFVTRVEAAYEVIGLSDVSKHRGEHVDSDSVDDLVRAGHARATSFPIDNGPPENAVALWLGDAFAKKARELGVEAPPLPLQNASTPEGTFAIGAHKDMRVYLEEWLKRAFARFLDTKEKTQRRQIAVLMRWALPRDPKTLAALWSSADNAEAELAWQVRTYKKKTSHSVWLQQLNDLLRKSAFEYKPPVVCAVAGGSSSLREQVAQQLVDLLRAEQEGVHLVTFEEPLDAEKHIDDPWKRKEHHAAVGQSRVEHGALPYALAALSKARHSRLIVLDSLRHPAVLEVLEWLFPRTLIIGVDAARERRQERWMKKGYRLEDFAKWLEGPMENQIPSLFKKASTMIYTNDTEPPSDQVADAARIALAQM